MNAKQAMWEGGLITVRAENTRIGRGRSLPMKSGKYIKISVEDHGTGISKEHAKKVFDPYFTTKQSGSGLGLATAFSIVKNHGGYITVRSELGSGTTFDLYLPASEKKLPAKEGKEGGQASASLGKVLVIDNEKMIREVVGEMLEVIGYEAGFAADGEEAVELYRKTMGSERSFDVVIVDLTVPGGMGGKETIKKLKEIDSKVNAIVSSGYSYDPIVANFEQYGFKGAVTKPYRITDLRDALSKALNSRQ